jgi:hypothetical protein
LNVSVVARIFSRKREERAMTSISKGDIVVGVIIGVIVILTGAVIYLIFVDRSLAPPLAVLLGAIAGSMLGFLGSILSVMWLEPERRDQEKKARAEETRTALYNQMMHLYIFAREAPQRLIEDPEIHLSFDAYTSAHADPIFFYSGILDSEVFDLTYKKLQETKRTILQIKADSYAGRSKKGIISNLVSSLEEIESGEQKGANSLARSEVGMPSKIGPSIIPPKVIQQTLVKGRVTVTDPQLRQEIENVVNYIDFLIIYGYFDIDLIKQVCNTTQSEKQTIKRLEELIRKKDRPIEERVKERLEDEVRGQELQGA